MIFMFISQKVFGALLNILITLTRMKCDAVDNQSLTERHVEDCYTLGNNSLNALSE